MCVVKKLVGVHEIYVFIAHTPHTAKEAAWRWRYSINLMREFSTLYTFSMARENAPNA